MLNSLSITSSRTFSKAFSGCSPRPQIVVATVRWAVRELSKGNKGGEPKRWVKSRPTCELMHRSDFFVCAKLSLILCLILVWQSRPNSRYESDRKNLIVSSWNQKYHLGIRRPRWWATMRITFEPPRCMALFVHEGVCMAPKWSSNDLLTFLWGWKSTECQTGISIDIHR